MGSGRIMGSGLSSILAIYYTLYHISSLSQREIEITEGRKLLQSMHKKETFGRPMAKLKSQGMTHAISFFQSFIIYVITL